MGTHVKHLGRRLAAAALLLGAILPAGAQDTSRVLDLVNGHRAVAGLAPLARVAELDSAALRHSRDMALGNFMSHTGSDGSSAGERIQAAGYDWSSYGENVAAGFATAESVVAAWMNSPSHRDNILGAHFRHLGVAAAFQATSRYGYYWTLDLASGTPSGAPAPGGDTTPPEEETPPPPPLPTITLVSPASGRVGTAVILYGTNFGLTRGTLRFNGTPASILSWSSTRIQATVPTGATSGPLSVTTSAGTISGPSFQVTAPTTTVSTAPRLLSLTLGRNETAGTLALTGENLGTTQGLGRVYIRRSTSTFSQSVTVLEWSATRVVVRLGTLPRGTYYVWVRRGDGRTSNTKQFTFP